MKNIIDALTDLVLKYTPFKGRRTKSVSLLVILAAVVLIATGAIEKEVGVVVIGLAFNDLFAADHKPNP